MPLIVTRSPRTSPPHGSQRADPSWIARGLKSLYLLRAGQWDINCVTGARQGSIVGAGVSFPGAGWLNTPGAAGAGALLPHGLDTSGPVTIVIGSRLISGSVAWSLLENTSGTTWTGWYGSGTGSVNTSVGNSFDGSLSLSLPSIAFSHYGSGTLIGASSNALLSDTSSNFSGSTTRNAVTLGYSNRGGSPDDNPAVAEFTHFAAIQGYLSLAELRQLATNPWQLFAPIERRIWVPSASSAVPSITAVYADSVTASSVVPRVTLDFA